MRNHSLWGGHPVSGPGQPRGAVGAIVAWTVKSRSSIASGHLIRFHAPMRFLLLLSMLAQSVSAAVPADLATALKAFRPDPPMGWSYTQTTAAEGRTRVEHFDATKPAFERWTLVQQDGRSPTADERKHYQEARSRWSRGGTAPKITDQLELGTLETISRTEERAKYRCHIQRGEAGDETARFLRAMIVLHSPTQTIESITLGSTGAFSPTFGVKIAEMTTQLSYRPPENDRPAMPLGVVTHVRGRAFWVKSLDADMTVTFSDYVRAAKK